VDAELLGEQVIPGTGLVNLLWIILAGIWLAIAHVVAGLACLTSIVGIPAWLTSSWLGSALPRWGKGRYPPRSQRLFTVPRQIGSQKGHRSIPSGRTGLSSGILARWSRNESWVMITVSKTTLFSTSLALIKTAAPKPLVTMDDSELEAVVDASIHCANLLIQKCSAGGGLTIREMPSPDTEFPMTAPEKPEWIRMPKGREKCKYTGLSRSFLYTLVSPSKENGYNPPVKSVSLRRRGMQKGVRLISYDSLMSYLQNLPENFPGGENEE